MDAEQNMRRMRKASSQKDKYMNNLSSIPAQSIARISTPILDTLLAMLDAIGTAQRLQRLHADHGGVAYFTSGGRALKAISGGRKEA